MPIFDRGKLVTPGDGYPTISKNINKVVNTIALTQAEYDRLPKKDKNTLYIIVEVA